MGNSMMRVRCDRRKILPLFLYYWLSSDEGKNYLLNRVSQVGVPQIQSPLTTLREASFRCPPIRDQEYIVKILGTLDDKIELNHKMNETLEAMAQTIFKSWFVDFYPVRAKMEGKQPAGMDAETAALFPGEFERVDGREVPKGWEVESIGNVIDLLYGKPLKQENRFSGTIPVFGSNGQIGWHDEKMINGPGIIVGRKGNPGIVTWAPTDFYSIDTTFYVNLKKKCISLFYMYHELQRQDLPSLGADSAVPGLNRNLVYLSKMVIPPSKILEKFDTILKSFDRIEQNNNNQSHSLTNLRDILLPKLMSGDILVKNGKYLGTTE